MPRKSDIQREALKNLEDLSVKSIIDTPEEKIGETKKGVTRYEYLRTMNYEDFCTAFEYMFLNRELHDVHGFCTNIHGYKANYESAWEQIEKCDLSHLFRGKQKGFIKIWLTPEMHQKLKKATISQWGAWLSYFDTAPFYRHEILNSSRHRIVLNSSVNPVVNDWLGGID